MILTIRIHVPDDLCKTKKKRNDFSKQAQGLMTRFLMDHAEKHGHKWRGGAVIKLADAPQWVAEACEQNVRQMLGKNS